jgi:hypothetical protein
MAMEQHSDGTISPSWQAKCPTCRAWFCLDDVLPCKNTTLGAFEGIDEPEGRGRR